MPRTGPISSGRSPSRSPSSARWILSSSRSGSRHSRSRREARADPWVTTVITALIDYGSGNLRSAAKAIERAAREGDFATDVVVTSDPDLVRKADRVVLPGVGAFADCRRGLAAVMGMEAALDECVTARGRPFLGICVGMQLMASWGRE